MNTNEVGGCKKDVMLPLRIRTAATLEHRQRLKDSLRHINPEIGTGWMVMGMEWLVRGYPD